MRLFLKSAFKGSSYSVHSLPGDGGVRRYFRIHKGRGKKNSHILVRASSLAQKKLFLKRRKELFKLKLPVPALKFTTPYSLYTLLEDLGDKSLKHLSPSSRMFYYREAIDVLFALQARAQSLKWPKHSYALLFKEMCWTKTFLVKKALKISAPEKFWNSCLKEWRHLCRILSQMPHLPGHRDFHSQNLMIKKKKLYMIDFQDASCLPPFYDTVSLFYDPYAALSLKEKKRLLKYVLHHPHRPFMSPEAFWHEWQLTALQRLFKACGNFAEFYVLKNKSTHLKYIGPALKDVEYMLRQVPGYPVFLKLTRLLIKRLPLWP